MSDNTPTPQDRPHDKSQLDARAEANRYNTLGISQATQNMLQQAIVSFSKAIEFDETIPATGTTAASPTPTTTLPPSPSRTSPRLSLCAAMTPTSSTTGAASTPCWASGTTRMPISLFALS